MNLAYAMNDLSPIKKDSEIGKWRSFVGVEAGVGVFGVSSSGFIFSGNSLFYAEHNTLGLGYSIGILGGWQKYTHEKVGMRNTLGFTFPRLKKVGYTKKLVF